MSHSLPPEIVDLIIDHLHDEPTILKTCSVVSKSWVPRTRKYLFASVEFNASVSLIKLWKKTFPDPSTSPAHHTRTLSIWGLRDVVAEAGTGGWIRTFHNVTHLDLSLLPDQVSTAPFYGLAPALKSLTLTQSPSEVLDIVGSFPVLEDLALVALYTQSNAGGRNKPLTSPKLTGTLDLKTSTNTRSVVRRLLDFPGSLHFSKINTLASDEDAKSVTDVLSSCSDTLESLTFLYDFQNEPRNPLLDLSKATKLKHLEFLRTKSSVQWITTTLQTLKSKNIQDITLYPVDVFPELIEEAVRQEWRDLDHLLVQLGTSQSIRTRVMYVPAQGWKDLRDYVHDLLPELIGRELVDLVVLELQ